MTKHKKTARTNKTQNTKQNTKHKTKHKTQSTNKNKLSKIYRTGTNVVTKTTKRE